MPYYIDPAKKQIFITIGTSDSNTMTKDMEPINGEVARKLQLWHQQPLNDSQIEALRQGSVDRFMAAPSSNPRANSIQIEGRQASRENTASAMPTSVARAANAAAVVEAFAWFCLVLGVIAGIVVASRTSFGVNDNGNVEKTHPYIGAGIGIAIGVAINCLMIIMVAAYIKAKMELARLER